MLRAVALTLTCAAMAYAGIVQTTDADAARAALERFKQQDAASYAKRSPARWTATPSIRQSGVGITVVQRM